MPSEYANDLMARVGLDTTEWKKGITDLNAGIKHIETGFQATAALMDDWSNSSDGLKKRIESLNDKLALQKQKLDILKKAYDEEVQANGESSKAAQELAKKMYQVKTEIDRTQGSLEGYNKKLDDMAVFSDKTAQKLDAFASKTRNLSTVATAGLAAIGAGLVKAGQNADELNTLAKQTGLTTEEIQKFKYASDLIDVELEDMTGALRKMTRNMISTSTEVQGAWETLGVSTKNVSGETKGVTEIFYEVLEALSKVKNETERDQLAMLLFGKSANDLAGIVDDGGAALQELGDEAEKLGLIMSQDAVDGANEFNDVIDKLKANVTASLGKAFSENAENLTEVAEDVAGALVGVVNAVADAPPWFTKTTLVVTGLAAVLSPLLSVSNKTVSAVVKLKNAYKAKTTETVKSTVAEGAHSTALDKTAKSASGAAKGVKGIGSAASSAVPYIMAIAAVFAVIAGIVKKDEEKLIEGIENTYDTAIEKSNEAYDNSIANLEEELENFEETQEKKITAANEFYDNEIDKLKENLESQKKALKTEQDLLEKAHKERMNQLEKERNLKLEIIDIQEEKETSELQKQIDALEALTEAEEKIKKEQENAKKFSDLQAAIDSATTYAEKVDAEKKYNEFLQELEYEKVLNTREAQKQELQNKIETIRQESENKREQINEEYESAKTLAENKYNLEKESLDLRLEALDTFIADETERLEAARESKLSILQEETDDYITELQKKIDKEKELKQAATDRIEAEKQEAIQEHKDSFLERMWGKIKVYWNDIQEINMKYPYAIGANASGTNFWRGGLTRINEEGGEILNLPRGTQIIPHDVSMEIARAAGQASVTNNSTTNNTNNSYNYGAQQQVTVLKVGDRTIAQVITPQVSVGLSDTIYRRRRAGGANK